MNCFFVSDLHGQTSRYKTLFSIIKQEKPEAVFLGGDLFPHFGNQGRGDFLNDFLAFEFLRLKEELKELYPRVFLIMGNDDSKSYQDDLIRYMSEEKIWDYIHNKAVQFSPYMVYGYAYVPPTPFLNKDWERYDVSRYVDPGCVPPEEGWHSVPEPKNIIEHATIQNDLEQLTAGRDLSQSIFLFHTPPYQTALDRAALDGKMIDHVPLDLHVGSIAVKNFILEEKPLLTLHGHVHESVAITGIWKEELGITTAISAAHNGPELALVRFNPEFPHKATRDLYEEQD